MRIRYAVLVSAVSVVAACSSGGGVAGSYPKDAEKSGDAGVASASSGGPVAPKGGPAAAPAAGAGLLPLVTPPVKAAAPAGFGGAPISGTMGLHVQDFPVPADPDAGDTSDSGPGPGAGGGAPPGTLAADDIRSRFFGAGPTDIYSILGSIDGRINDINAQVARARPKCLDITPIAYPVTPFGQSLTFYAQCYQRIEAATPSSPGFVQLGQKDGVTYYYSAEGVAWVAAILTPKTDGDGGTSAGGDDAGGDDGGDGGTSATTYSVQMWSGIGYRNAPGCGDGTAFDDCSYGVIQLQADAAAHTFEMTVAGVGFGYCGAQLKSDGSSVFAIGSIDMASSCTSAGTLCVAASDIATSADCGESVTSFSLPALGRVSSAGPHAGGPGVDAGPNPMWAPSQYPGEHPGAVTNGITLDGTSNDSLHFGPIAPAPGTDAFSPSSP